MLKSAEKILCEPILLVKLSALPIWDIKQGKTLKWDHYGTLTNAEIGRKNLF